MVIYPVWSFLCFLFLLHCALFTFWIFILFMFYECLRKMKSTGFCIFLLHQMYYAFFHTSILRFFIVFLYFLLFLLLADLIYLICFSPVIWKFYFYSASDYVFSLIPFSTVLILLYLSLYFGDLVFIFISISRKLHVLFSDHSWQPTFAFISVLSSCISENSVCVLCYMSPGFPCINWIFAVGPFGLNIQLAAFKKLILFTS